MPLNISTRLPSNLSQSLKSLPLKPLGISTLSTRPSWRRSEDGFTSIEKVRDILTKEEYLMVFSTDNRGSFKSIDGNQLSIVPTEGPINQRSSRKGDTSHIRRSNCISLSNDEVFRINSKPLVMEEGTLYYAKPLPLSLKESTTAEAKSQVYQSSPILDLLKSRGSDVGDCLGLNILIRDHRDLLDGKEKGRGKEMEIRSLYSLAPLQGQDSIDTVSESDSKGDLELITVDDEKNNVSWYDPTLIRKLPEDSEMYTVGAIPLDEVLGNLDK
ncbi:hypothetical protein L486_05176 [Kwoniella mangroviensis CBS 10435]|uniref:Uncharacterized protein n=1 Tax=Kwoniella mangroviensis CBS 10435 TaxID=1331196 RepID=A0A1B9IQA8_9TREE|nr:hypothetical protein L486_05176 [Kwoniella mangroviensis CBS 10435]